MWRTRHVLAAIVCTIAVATAICFAEKPPASVMQTLEHRAARVAVPPGDQAARLQRRADTAKELAASLCLPPREPMKAAVLFTKQEDGLVNEEIAYLWAERAYAFAHAIYGKQSAARKPAVIMIPGRLGHYRRAAYKDVVQEMARRDCLVLFVDDPHVGKRNAPEAGLHAVAAASGVPVQQIQLFDALRALDYLLTRSDVDPSRIALVGFDRGAEAAALAGAMESRFQFVVTDVKVSETAAARLFAESIGDRIAKLPTSNAAPLPCGKPEDPDFSMLRFVQRRIARQLASRPAAPSDAAAWKAHREELVQWLGKACGLERMRPGPARVVARTKQDGLSVETVALPIDGDLTCLCRVVQQAEPGSPKRSAVILSHGGRQCISTPQIDETARRLASLGYCVILPEHASPDPKSLRAIEETDLERFHAAADQAGISPLALRVEENLAAFRYLAGRSGVDLGRIVMAGQGIGGIDACLAALLESRIAGVVSIDATTIRDWAEKVAPEEESFSGIMPYLPSILTKGDFDSFYAALAPRPLVLAKLRDGWPKPGFQQVATTASLAYRLQKSESALVVVSPREALEERERRLPEGAQRQLVAIARNLLPAPPTPGVIGGRDILKPRPIIDSASGVVWVVHVLGGVEQEFVDGGYRLTTWSFVNDLGAGQRGRSVTPLVFKKEGSAYRLTGIGKTRANTGAGLQTFAFEPVQGSNAVSAGYFFGFYTGDPAGKPDAGVVPFDEGRQDRMTILALDGQLGDQKVSLGKLYGEQSSYPRTYSIQAISERK